MAKVQTMAEHADTVHPVAAVKPAPSDVMGSVRDIAKRQAAEDAAVRAAAAARKATKR